MAPVKIKEVSSNNFARKSTGMGEFDRALGGGVVPGSVVLLTGEPGIGKSTLLLQLKSDFKTLYIAGEESPEQIKMRFDRLKNRGEEFFVLPEVDVDLVTQSARGFDLVIVDSIQSMKTEDLDSPAGSISQVRETSYRLHRFAKENGVAIFLIGHITKEGALAGPKVLEHLVDTVLYFEGDKSYSYRLLRATKNRFGPLQEVGVFRMNDQGLIEVSNPSELFLEERTIKEPGGVVVPTLEGARVILTEIQALASPTAYGMPLRRASGVDLNRLTMLSATLTRRALLSLQSVDIFVNVAGGLKIFEPAADLGVCLAIASSLKNKALKDKTIVIGEVGLLGEVRNVLGLDQRLKEAKKLGFTNFITPKEVKSLREAIKLALE